MNKKCFFSLLLLTSLALNFINAQKNFQFGGPNRDGVYSETNLLKQWPKEGPKMLWKFDSLGIGYSSPAVVDDLIYITGNIDSTGYLFALTHDGKLAWKKPYGFEWKKNYPGTRSSPLIYDGLGYIYSGLGVIYCFNLKTGDFNWTVDVFKDYGAREAYFGMAENLLVYNDKLICTPGGVDANVIALDRKTGKLIWKSKGVGEISAYCSPKIINYNDKNYLITITSNSIISLNPDNGKVNWRFDLSYPDGIHSNIPLYHNGCLFAMNGWKYGSVMMKLSPDGDSVTQVWRSKYHDLEHGSVVLVGNTIYGADYTSKYFVCTDWNTGAALDTIKDLAPSSVVLADDLIYCYTYTGEVALLKPLGSSIEIISRFQVPGIRKNDHIAFPVINKGIMYLRYGKSLWAYSIKNE